MYKPSELYSAALGYALNRVDDKERQIFILSAKHGLLELSDRISPYDMTLKNMSSDECDEWGHRVFTKLSQLVDVNNTEFVILAGQDYTNPFRLFLVNLREQLKGKAFGPRIQWLKQNTANWRGEI